jgi:hypothetical protein
LYDLNVCHIVIYILEKLFHLKGTVSSRNEDC